MNRLTGAVTIEQIRGVLPDAREVGHDPDRGANADVRSPGTLHPHYQPRAKVRLIDSPRSFTVSDGARVAYCGLLPSENQQALVLTAVFDSLADYAAGFYEFLREADRQQATEVCVQRAPDEGIGHALLDRQQRAAGER